MKLRDEIQSFCAPSSFKRVGGGSAWEEPEAFIFRLEEVAGDETKIDRELHNQSRLNQFKGYEERNVFTVFKGFPCLRIFLSKAI